MNSTFHLIEIIKDGLSTIEARGKRLMLLFVFPLLIGALLEFYAKINISKDYIDGLISSLSIFTGFFFTLIVYVADKAANKKNQYRIEENEEDKRFLNSYLTFTERLISQISYSIFLSILVIASSLLSQLKLPCLVDGICEYINSGIEIVIFSLIVHFGIYLLLIVSNMYALFLEEIKRK